MKYGMAAEQPPELDALEAERAPTPAKVRSTTQIRTTASLPWPDLYVEK